jgi:predicted RNA-binding Zn ribbon-like protein
MHRPLTGEPLALDLVNTRWLRGGAECDALATIEDLVVWLGERGLSQEQATEPVRATLLHTRAVLRAVVEGGPGAAEQLNAVLARGFVVSALDGGRVHQRVVFADDTWGLAWRAADDYLRLVTSGPERIRRCEHPACVLYFYDTSGRRRWCSMAGCGNRAKAQRHHARTRRPQRQRPSTIP